MKRVFFYCTVSAVSLLLISSGCSKAGSAPSPAPGDPDPVPGHTYNIRVTTFAGKAGVTGKVDAKGDAARFSSPGQMVFDDRNQTLYVADQGFNGLAIRGIDLEGNVTTYVDQNDIFTSIGDIAIAPGTAGSLYMTSTMQDALFAITKDAVTGKGNIEKIAGFNGSGNTNGTIAAASFDGPKGLITDRDGNIYVANDYYNTIRKISLTRNSVSGFAGKPAAHALDLGGFADGNGEAAEFNGIHDMIMSADGKFLIVPDYSNNALRKISLDNAKVNTYFGRPLSGIDTDGTFAEAEAGNPEVAVCDKDNNVYFTSFLPGYTGTKIRVAHLNDNTVRTIAGGQGAGNSRYQDGTGTEARFNGIKGIAVTSDGKILFVADMNNHCIRKISLY
jgi:DNA-binding beta-propeller fold protein YncE